MHFDNTDKLILLELAKNSKIPQTRLAKKLGIAYNTLESRIKKMEEKGIIKGYTACIDFEKLGFDRALLTTYSIDWKSYGDEARQMHREHSKKSPEAIFHLNTPIGAHHGFILSLHQGPQGVEKFLDNTIRLGSTKDHLVSKAGLSDFHKLLDNGCLVSLVESIDLQKVPTEKKDEK